MDISFDIRNSEGDHIMVALSYYDRGVLTQFTSDTETLALDFCDVSLLRK